MKRPDFDSLASQLVRLSALDRTALAAEWLRINKVPPPTNMSRGLMLRALAYQIQENACGGLKKSVRAQLFSFASAGNIKTQPIAQVATGTRLLREWHGVTHEVIIEELGVRYRGETYGSLSQVAHLITGAKWSGPAFFGLRKRAA